MQNNYITVSKVLIGLILFKLIRLLQLIVREVIAISIIFISPRFSLKMPLLINNEQKQARYLNIDTENPDILVNVHIYQDNCVLSLDSSGFSLHRRGYRPAMGLAPLEETLASALLAIA